MTLFGGGLRLTHRVALILLLGNVAAGYATKYERLGVAAHIASGFFSSLVIAFAHAMTLFYFAGMGVGLREAAAGHHDCAPILEEAAGLRRRLALPLGLALVSLMAAVILGGGSHTKLLPGWAHHVAALAALGLNLFAIRRSLRFIAASEALALRMQHALDGAAGGGAAAGEARVDLRKPGR